MVDEKTARHFFISDSFADFSNSLGTTSHYLSSVFDNERFEWRGMTPKVLFAKNHEWLVGLKKVYLNDASLDEAKQDLIARLPLGDMGL